MTKLDFVIAYNCALAPMDYSRQLRADVLTAARDVEHVTLESDTTTRLMDVYTGFCEVQS